MGPHQQQTIYLIGGGTRGDVQPLFSLGHRLRQEGDGYRVVLMAGEENASCARDYGFGFVELFSFKRQLQEPEMRRALQEAADDSVRVWQVFGQLVAAHVDDDITAAMQAIGKDPSAVATITTSAHAALGTALAMKFPHIVNIALSFQPMCPSKCYPPSLFDVRALPVPEACKAWPAPAQRCAQKLQQLVVDALFWLWPGAMNQAFHGLLIDVLLTSFREHNERTFARVGVELGQLTAAERRTIIRRAWANLEGSGSLTIYAFSKHLFARPPTDLPPQVTDATVGYFFPPPRGEGEADDQRLPPPELKAFLADHGSGGDKEDGREELQGAQAPASGSQQPRRRRRRCEERQLPLYVGFGSMTISDRARMVRILLGALRLSQRRAVVLRGWAELGVDCLDPVRDAALVEFAGSERGCNVLWMEEVPHEWLLPRCAASLVHGGAGTTAAALRAGRPVVVMPFGFDQGFMADRVVELGVGLRAPPMTRCTPAALAALLRRAATDRLMAARAAALGARLRAEDGPGLAAAIVREEILAHAARRECSLNACRSSSPDAAGSPDAVPGPGMRATEGGGGEAPPKQKRG